MMQRHSIGSPIQQTCASTSYGPDSRGTLIAIVDFLLNLFSNDRIFTIFALLNNNGMKSDELHRLVARNGWTVLRQAGSHMIYRKGARTYPVPHHRGKEVASGLARKIIKEMGLK